MKQTNVTVFLFDCLLSKIDETRVGNDKKLSMLWIQYSLFCN